MPYFPPPSAGGGGTGQVWKVDRTPVETPNGTLTVFSVPTGDTYIADHLLIYLNGQAQTKASDFTETTGSTFTLTAAPLTGDTIRLTYRTA